MEQGINISRVDVQKIFPDEYLGSSDAGLVLFKKEPYWELIDGWNAKYYILTNNEDKKILTDLGY